MYMERKKFSWAAESTKNDFWDEQELTWRIFNILPVKNAHECEQNIHSVSTFYYFSMPLLS